MTAGGTHRPSITSTLGEYTRNVMLKSSVGAGSQFDPFSAPGDACWIPIHRIRAHDIPKVGRGKYRDVSEGVHRSTDR